jgi:hypothetical protein
MYQITRQLDLLQSTNWEVVRATTSDKKKLLRLVEVFREHLKASDMFTDVDKLAHALVDFTALMEVVAAIGELPFPENQWMLGVAEKLLHWFGPEEEIRQQQGAP